MDWSDYSVVGIGGGVLYPWHHVHPDVVLSLRMAWQQVKAKGYTRIGIAPFRHNSPLEDDIRRFHTACGLITELPEPDRIPPLLCTMDDDQAFLGWVKEYRPDAVIAFHDGPHWWLTHAGYSIPQDIGYARLAGYSIRPGSQGTRSGVKEHLDKVCDSAVELMDMLVRHQEKGLPETPWKVQLKPEWQEGDSLRSTT